MQGVAMNVPDIPAQEHEPWRKQTNCANCPFAETDQDDGKLYCHESSAKAQAIVIAQPARGKPLFTPQSARPEPKPEVDVLGVVSYWPEVQPEWSCWRHPNRQAERRRLFSHPQ